MSERGGVSRGRALVTLSFKGESLWVVQDWSKVQLMLTMTHLSMAPWNSQPAVVEATAFRLVTELHQWGFGLFGEVSHFVLFSVWTLSTLSAKKKKKKIDMNDWLEYSPLKFCSMCKMPCMHSLNFSLWPNK